jgi:amidase
MRPTHGRISLDGVLKNAPDCDTVGWFARDAELCARIGEILLQSETPKVFPRHLVVAQDAFDLSDPDVATALQPTVDRVASLVASSEHLQLSPAGLSAWPEQQLILTARQALDSAQCWIERVNPRFGFDVAQRYANALSVTAADLAAARQARAAIRNRIDAILQDDVVICLPTTPVPAPPLGQTANQRKACRQRIVSLTCIAGTCGIPQISLPLAAVGGLPVGLSLMGARGADELIVGFAREVAATAAP